MSQGGKVSLSWGSSCSASVGELGGHPRFAWFESKSNIDPGVESANLKLSEEGNKTLNIAICFSGLRLRTGAKLYIEFSDHEHFPPQSPSLRPPPPSA